MPESTDRPELTRLLRALTEGRAEAESTLLPHVYGELRAIAGGLARGRPVQALQPTELVNEAFVRLFEREVASINDRRHFYALAAQAMRQILADDARARGRLKRGGGAGRELLDEAVAVAAGADVGVLDLDEALGELAEAHPRQARVIEMRFFGGMGMDDVAEVLGVSQPTAEREWYAARAWLGRRLKLGEE